MVGQILIASSHTSHLAIHQSRGLPVAVPVSFFAFCFFSFWAPGAAASVAPSIFMPMGLDYESTAHTLENTLKTVQ